MKNTFRNQFISFRVPNTIKEKIEHYAEREWMSTSDICRLGVKKALEELSERHDSPNQPKTWSV